MAQCSLQGVEPFRMVEVPLWMLDVATCSRTCVAVAPGTSVASLRELKTLLSSAPANAGEIWFKLSIKTCSMQEVLMSMLPSRPGSAQLPLFSKARQTPNWLDLPPEVRQKILRLLTQMLQEHCRGLRVDDKAEETRDE